MDIAYLAITIVLASIVLFSGIGKLRNDPRIVKVIHEVVGVPMKYFPLLAACEFAGAVGLVLASGGHHWALRRLSDWSSTSWAQLCHICV